MNYKNAYKRLLFLTQTYIDGTTSREEIRNGMERLKNELQNTRNKEGK